MVLLDEFPPKGVIEDWSDWLHEEGKDDEAEERIRRQTRTGRPCGSSSFLDPIEYLLHRTVRPKKGEGRERTSETRIPWLSPALPAIYLCSTLPLYYARQSDDFLEALGNELGAAVADALGIDAGAGLEHLGSTGKGRGVFRQAPIS